MSFSRPAKEKDTDAEHALAAALRLLARREYSRRELRQKLSLKFSPEAAEAALQHCLEHNYQSDSRYADMLLRHLLSCGYGPGRYYYDASAKGVAEAVASECAAQADWEEAAVHYLQKRWRAPQRPDPDSARKLLAALSRRGFSPSLCSSALERFYQLLDLNAG